MRACYQAASDQIGDRSGQENSEDEVTRKEDTASDIKL
jgi:hypothetical protein